MASPFHYFRKHQKPLIAAAAVLCMVIFVFSDALVGLIKSAASGGGAGRSAKSSVATWDGGSLNERDLAILRSRRYFLSEFLRRLEITGAQRVVADGGTPTKPMIPEFILPEKTSARAVEMSVVTSRVFADLASRMGIRVSDEVVNHYLREAGFHHVGGDEIVAMLKGFRVADRQASVDVLFASLRDNLLAHTYQNGTSFASQTILPEQRWEDWRRVNDRIALEVAILPSQAVAADVPDPSDAEVLAFYEEYKDREAGQSLSVMGRELPSPDPGFAQPRKVRLQYLLGDVFSWSEKLQGSVTDAEIEDYYQRNKRTQFVQMDTEIVEPSASETGTEQAEPKETSEEQQETSDGKPSSDTPEKGNDAGTAPETGGPAEDGADKPAEGGTDKPKDGAGKTGDLRRHNPFRLVALQRADAAEVEGDKADDGSSDGKNADSDDGREAGEEVSVAPEDVVEARQADATDSVETEEEKVEYQPLEEVSDQIRRQLATEKSVDQLKTTADRLFTRLRAAYNPYGEKRAIAHAQGDPMPAPPKQLTSLADLAKEYGLIYEETPLLSGMQLARESLVGKAMDAQTGRASVTQRMLSKHDLYDPLLAQDIDGNWYVVIKVEDVPRHVPPLDEIRDEVIGVWKAREASKLALEKAESWATEVQSSSEPFTDFFHGKQLTDKSEVEVVTTDLFSWLTYGATPAEMQRGPRLGEAPPLVAIGPDFMIKAFELKEGEVKTLQNFDHSQAYVATLHQRQRSEEELRKLFLEEANSWFGARYAAAGRWQQFQRQVFQQLTERVGLEFAEGWGQEGP